MQKIKEMNKGILAIIIIVIIVLVTGGFAALSSNTSSDDKSSEASSEASSSEAVNENVELVYDENEVSKEDYAPLTLDPQTLSIGDDITYGEIAESALQYDANYSENSSKYEIVAFDSQTNEEISTDDKFNTESAYDSEFGIQVLSGDEVVGEDFIMVTVE